MLTLSKDQLGWLEQLGLVYKTLIIQKVNPGIYLWQWLRYKREQVEICKGSRVLSSVLVYDHFHPIVLAEASHKLSIDSRGRKIDYACLVRGTAKSHVKRHEYKEGVKNRSHHCNFPLYPILSSYYL